MVSDQELAELQKQRGVDQRKRKSSFLEFGRTDRLIFLRNGAFLFNIDENLEYPGTLRMEMLLSSWAQHLLQVHGWFTLPTNLRLFAGVNLRADVSI